MELQDDRENVFAAIKRLEVLNRGRHTKYVSTLMVGDEVYLPLTDSRWLDALYALKSEGLIQQDTSRGWSIAKKEPTTEVSPPEGEGEAFLLRERSRDMAVLNRAAGLSEMRNLDRAVSELPAPLPREGMVLSDAELNRDEFLIARTLERGFSCFCSGDLRVIHSGLLFLQDGISSYALPSKEEREAIQRAMVMSQAIVAELVSRASDKEELTS